MLTLLLTELATHQPLLVPRHLGPLPRLVHGKLHPFQGRRLAPARRPSSLTCCPLLPPGVACSVILMYTFCTDCWLIAVLYFTWLAFDWNTPKKGNRLLSACVSPTLASSLCAAAAPPPGCCLFFMEHLLCERPGLGCMVRGG